MYIGSDDPQSRNPEDDSLWNRLAGNLNDFQNVQDTEGKSKNDDELGEDIVDDDDCESDYVAEYTHQRMDEYLKHRRECLLKYCGDVCITSSESGGGK